jgi:hypothetical protein
MQFEGAVTQGTHPLSADMFARVTDEYLPPDEVLLELGRLAWASITLEQLAYTVCRSIKRIETFNDTPIGTRIEGARKDLATYSDQTLRLRADIWLQSAAEALQLRNSVFHGTPFTFEPWLPEINPGNLDPMIGHLSRDRSRSATHTPLTITGISSVHNRLTQAAVGGLDLAFELDSAES